MKHLKSFLFISLVSISLFSCGGKEKQTGFKPVLPTDTACNVFIKGHYDNFESMNPQILAFKKYYKNVNVKYEKVDDYAKEKTINNLFSSDNAPDIYFINTAWESDAKYAKLFEYAEDLSDPSTGIELSNIREGLIYKDGEGHVPFVPIFTNTYGMIVNEEIFSKNNLKIPKTYEDLITVSNALVGAGYTNPIMSYNASIYSLYFPHFMASISNNAEAVSALNSMGEGAGEYIRGSLNLASDFLSHNYIDKDKCVEEIAKDNTDSICFRFYKGDVPMMFTEVNRLSGSAKREGQSEEYQDHKFKYSFHPVPSNDKGGYYYNTLTLSFAVNKESPNLAMANEFMRFLITAKNLNEMCLDKRQISPAKQLTKDQLFGSFKDVLADNRVIYNYEIGLTEAADQQVRKTFNAFIGGATIDEAINGYGGY